MAFKNEKIPEQDKVRIAPLVNYERLKKFYLGVVDNIDPIWWTVDREKDVYLISLGGGGRGEPGQMPYCVLGIGDQIVFFNVIQRWQGDKTVGLKHNWEVHNLRIPAALKSRREEIKQLIREAMEEYSYFRPFADGGTRDNPNTTARGNIISFNLEFK